jgi:hypothetical protein
MAPLSVFQSAAPNALAISSRLWLKVILIPWAPSSQYSNYGYTTTPENFITAISETSDAPSVYPTTTTQTANYNNLNQLTNL